MVATARLGREIVLARTNGWIAPVGLGLFAFLLRVGLVWRTGFDGLYGQDPFAYLDYAAAFKDALAHFQFPPPFFWPMGYPALAAALSTFLPLSMAAQTVSMASGTLVAVLVSMMIREILGEQRFATVASLFAGVLVASAGRLLISSVSTMSDAASLFWATLSAYALLRFRRNHAVGWIALAAFALGWAMITRWVYGLLIPVWALAMAVELRKRLALVRVGVVAAIFFGMAVLPQGLLMLKATGTDLAFIGEAQIYSWNPLNAFQSDIHNADGHLQYNWTMGAFYSLPFIQPDYMPIWYTPLVLLGIWALYRRRTELILLLGWLVVMWGLLIGVLWENWRFPLAFFAPLAVLAGIGLGKLFQMAPQGSARLIGGWLGLGLLVACGWGLYDASSFIGRQLDERAIVSWVNERIPANASILTFGQTATLQHFTSHRVVEMALESPRSVEAIAREGRDVFVLLNIDNVETQWKGLAPQVNFQALEDHFVLRKVASRGAYVLYAVVQP